MSIAKQITAELKLTTIDGDELGARANNIWRVLTGKFVEIGGNVSLWGEFGWLYDHG
jgi:hypothetical protein